MKASLSAILLALSQITVAQIKISGVLQDADTQEKIQFAHVSFSRSIIGTSTNSDGYFEMSAARQDQVDSIQISHISYKAKKIALTSLDVEGSNMILLEPNVIQLQEVVISGETPYQSLVSILKKAKSSVDQTFSSKYYYREIVKQNDEYTKYADAILISNFSGNDELQVGVEQVRAVNLPKENDDVVDVLSPLEGFKVYWLSIFQFP